MTEAFEKAFEEYADAIFRHCFFRVSDREKAKDLTQECFLRTWDYVSRGNDIQNIRAFLYRTAHNLIVDEYRRRKDISLDAMREDGGFDPMGDGAADVMVSVGAKEAVEAIRKIDPAYRDVVLMRYVDEMSPKEIAVIVGESENAVSVRIHRGVKKVREVLGELP